VLPFQQPPIWSKNCSRKPSEFETIATVCGQHSAIRRFKKSSRETEMLADVTLYLSRP
jgi:hypothetical protein